MAAWPHLVPPKWPHRPPPLTPRHRDALRAQRQRAHNEFEALRGSWANESRGIETPLHVRGTQFESGLRIVESQHSDLLDSHRDDVEKFLIGAPIRLAKHDGEYSWDYGAKLGEEINRVLDGILAGKSVHHGSIGFLARCLDAFPSAYSRDFLKAELERRFDARRVAPRPDFQLTLDYARRLKGAEFEEWLERLIRENGISSVQRTQQSWDQGADLIVEIGQRKIVIQAKQCPEATVGNDAVQEAHAARGFYGASDAWVVITSTFTKDAMNLASRLGVRLITGSQLLNLPALLLAFAAPPSSSPSINEFRPSAQPPIATAEPPPGTSQRAPEECVMTGSQAPSKIEPRGGEHVPPNQAQEVVASLAIGTQVSNLGAFSYRRRWLALVAGGIIAATAIYAARQQAIKSDTKHAIQMLLDDYQIAVRTKNLASVGECYAPVLEQYYLLRNVPRERVQREIGRAFTKYEWIAKLSLTNIAFNDLNGARVTATFDKEWDFRGTKGFAGSEKQEMVFVKKDGQWRIASEREVRVYWVRHPG